MEQEKNASGGDSTQSAPPPPKNPIEDVVLDKFPEAQTRYNFSDLEITVPPRQVRDLCLFLANLEKNPYDFLRNHTAIDWKDRIELVYHLCATSNMNNIIVKTSVPHYMPDADSVTMIWSGADWQEREVFDLFGVKYRGHPDLRRILLPDEWEGHPLLKDYKVQQKEVESWRPHTEPKN